MACDAKLNFDDNAEWRQPETFKFRDYTQEDTREARRDGWKALSFVCRPLGFHLSAMLFSGVVGSICLLIFFLKKSSGGWVKVKLKVPHVHVLSKFKILPRLDSNSSSIVA